MPRIDQIEIPEELWHELIHAYSDNIASEIIAKVESSYPKIDTTKQRNQLGLHFDSRLLSLEYRLMALIQLQKGCIEVEPEFGNILSAVFRITDQLTFDTLFNLSHLRSVIDQRLKTAGDPDISSI